MNKLTNLFLIIILIYGCSFNRNSKFWSNSETVLNENNTNYEEVFPSEDALKKEFNSDLIIKLISPTVNTTFLNNNY